MAINHEIQEESAFVARTFDQLENTTIGLHIILKEYYDKGQNDKHIQLYLLCRL